MAINQFFSFLDVSIIPEEDQAGRLMYCNCTTEQHRPEFRERGRKMIRGKEIIKTATIPLNKAQILDNICHIRISLAGTLAEEVMFGGSGPGFTGNWEGLKERENTDLAHIKLALRANLTTKDKKVFTDQELDPLIAELRAETKLLFISTMGSVTDLWVKTCLIAQALEVKRTLTFTECWKIFDG